MTKIQKNSKVFRYTRGDKFSCLVVINSFTDTVMFERIVYPSNVSDAVIEKFLDDAEKFSREQLEKGATV